MSTQPLNYVEISQKALLANTLALRSLCSAGTRLIAVVKANAYGHGLAEVVKTVASEVDAFAVDDLDELAAIRRLTNQPVLVLGYVPCSQLADAVALEATLGIYNLEQLQILDELGQKLGRKPTVHIKIDALLGRQGVPLNEIESFAQAAQAYRHINIAAIYSHFSNIEDTMDLSHTKRQVEEFKKATDVFKHLEYQLFTHISATSGLMTYDHLREQNAYARCGIGLYGMWPSQALKNIQTTKITLKPVLRWVSHLAQVKLLPADYPIGYGLTHITSKPTKLAIVPQGYSDGY